MEESILDPNRVLGIDFGKRFVGVAVSDPLFITAQSVCAIERKRADKLRKTLRSISEICKEYHVSQVVIGLPKNLDGTENERCEYTREFAQALFLRVGIPVFFWDERLTTVSSDKELAFMGVKDTKSHSDELSAMMILQGFMDARKGGVKLTPEYS